MSINNATSGLRAATTNLGVISNNIANANTIGFKESRAMFTDLYPGAGNSRTVGIGTQTATIQQQFRQGNFYTTGNSLDLGIQGSGFFELQNAQNVTVYGRNGSFTVNPDGYFEDINGSRLVGANGLVRIEESDRRLTPVQTTDLDIKVNLDSSVTAINRNATQPPSVPFDPTARDSYHFATSSTAFDSLGNPHQVTLYFTRTNASVAFGANLETATNTYNNALSDALNDATTSPLLQAYLATPNATTTAALQANAFGATFLNAQSALATTQTNAGAASGVSVPVATQNNFNTALAAVVADATARPLLATLLAAETAVPPDQATITAATTALNGNALGATFLTNRTALTTARDATSAGLPTTDQNTWEMYYTIDGGLPDTNPTVAGLQPTLRPSASPVIVSFDANGQFTSHSLTTINATNSQLTVVAPVTDEIRDATNPAYSRIQLDFDDVNAIGPGTPATPFTLNLDLRNSTQYNAVSRVVEQSTNGNGAADLDLVNVEVDTDGLVFGRYNDGSVRRIDNITLITFANERGLQPIGDSYWIPSGDSGTPLKTPPGSGSAGTIKGGVLELSNVDLTEELVDMISAQRHFQANAQVITTLDQIDQRFFNR